MISFNNLYDDIKDKYHKIELFLYFGQYIYLKLGVMKVK